MKSLSPRRDNAQSGQKTFERLYRSGRKEEKSPGNNDGGQDNENKPKLRGDDCDKLYNRMKEYEH